MAVTTGTTWDIVLANDAPSSEVTGPGADSTVSPRAAYQAALYGRAVLVDVRSGDRRRAQGALPAELLSAVVDRDELGLWLSESLAVRVLLLDDGEGALPRDARVAVVREGFAGWLAAGLPTDAVQNRRGVEQRS